MDFSKQEVQAVQETLEAVADDVKQLLDLQLVAIGGGCGEVIFG